MTAIFLKILNMSISAGWLVLAVVLLRLLIKKAPKWTHVLLWGLVAMRLLLPFSIESPLSLIPSVETIPTDIVSAETPAINSGFDAVNEFVNPVLGEMARPSATKPETPLDSVAVPPTVGENHAPSIEDDLTPVGGEDRPPAVEEAPTTVPTQEKNLLKTVISYAAVIWSIGMAAMLCYTLISYVLLRRKVASGIPLEKNLYQSEYVASPFVLGVIKPKIYLPFHMKKEALSYVVAHENAHLRRGDHLWKPLGFLLLSVYWFNPLMWVAYVLLCRDIELACDERVIRDLGSDARADYTEALVACSVNHRMIAACPLAFGEVGVKARVKSILDYKKPTLWILLAAILTCIVLAVCFLTNPMQKPPANIPNLEELSAKTDAELEVLLGGVSHKDLTAAWGEPALTGLELSSAGWDINDASELLCVYFDEDDRVARANFAPHGEKVLDDKTTESVPIPPFDMVKTLPAEQMEVRLIGVPTDTLAEIWGAPDAQNGYGRLYYEWESEGMIYTLDIFQPLGTVKELARYSRRSMDILDPDYRESLREKFPMYFDLPTENGLSVYVWQMAEGLYDYGLLANPAEGTHAEDEIWLLHKNPASLEEMCAILASYSPRLCIDTTVSIVPVSMLHSSYYYDHLDPDYWEVQANRFWNAYPYGMIDCFPLPADFDATETADQYAHASVYMTDVYHKAHLYVPAWDKLYPVYDLCGNDIADTAWDLQSAYIYCASAVGDTLYVFARTENAEKNGTRTLTLYKAKRDAVAFEKSTLTLSTSSAGQSSYFCSMIDETHGYLSVISWGESGRVLSDLLYTEDGGATWQARNRNEAWPVIEDGALSVATVHFYNENDGILATSNWTKEKGILYTTRNGGGTWQRVHLGLTELDAYKAFLYRYVTFSDFDFDGETYTISIDGYLSDPQEYDTVTFRFCSTDLIHWTYATENAVTDTMKATLDANLDLIVSHFEASKDGFTVQELTLETPDAINAIMALGMRRSRT